MWKNISHSVYLKQIMWSKMMQFWATNDSQFHQTVRRLLLTADTFELIIGVRAVTSLVTFLRDGDTRSVLAATLIETHRITLCNISPVNVSRCFSQYYTLLMLLVQHWTRRVAVYLETLQYMLEEGFPPAYSTRDTSHTTVRLYTDAKSHSCHDHIDLFTFASWLSKMSTVTVNDCRKFG